MIKVKGLYESGGKLKKCAPGQRCACRKGERLEFSWAVSSGIGDNFQAAFCLTLSHPVLGVLYDSGRVEKREQTCTLDARNIPRGREITVSITLWDRYGNSSGEFSRPLVLGDTDMSQAKWIQGETGRHGVSCLFRRDFYIDTLPEDACIYACGIGYHRITVNGRPVDDAVMDPAHTNYAKSVQYAVIPGIHRLLKKGKNTIAAIVGDGWRYNNTDLFETLFKHRKIEFFGDTALLFKMELFYKEKTSTLVSDGDWRYKYGAVTEGSVFYGETFDGGRFDPAWDLPSGGEGFIPVSVCPGPGGKPVPMEIEPIRVKKEYLPKSCFYPNSGGAIYDFGQNMAGVCRIKVPKGMKKGQRITLVFGEMLDEDGSLYNLPLRDAKQTDVYIASGEDDIEYWQPSFTYHGFRYVHVQGMPPCDEGDIVALAMYTDIDKNSSFVSGNALLNSIHKAALQTERANIHSIMTDCPQRNERMAWMNDATVRFTEAPYNFDTAVLFRKIIEDIKAEQRQDGAFTCCAPFLYGSYPADPVCSSFLVAGLEAAMHGGCISHLDENFEYFEAWERSLLSRSTDYIVNYSYYGDWAAPAYACRSGEDAYSSVTDGIFMSTGYSYYNCRLLSLFAEMTGREEKQREYALIAENIKNAMLNKWLDGSTGKMGNGSEAMQAFSLHLGIIPPELEEKAARIMADDLRERNYMFTTGNLCTLYMLEQLVKYGYCDDAYTLLTREEYPSYGFMLQNEATTIWERFELKKEDAMNSHNHPMYASVDKWLYSHLCGITPTAPGFRRFTVKPCFPKGLLSADCTVDTVMGDITVRWVNRFNGYKVYVTVPFGCECKVILPGQEHNINSGSRVFYFNEGD